MVLPLWPVRAFVVTTPFILLIPAFVAFTAAFTFVIPATFSPFPLSHIVVVPSLLLLMPLPFPLLLHSFYVAYCCCGIPELLRVARLPAHFFAVHLFGGVVFCCDHSHLLLLVMTRVLLTFFSPPDPS